MEIFEAKIYKYSRKPSAVRVLFDTPRLGNKKHGREGLNPPGNKSCETLPSLIIIL